MMIGILQPGYLPWLGFFEQLYRTDIFVIYDDVQYDKHSWRNRNRIKTANGPQWLTVPVLVSLTDAPLICEVKIDNKQGWKKKHLFSIKQNYSKAPFYDEYIQLFERAYEQEWQYLIDINMYFINSLAASLGIDARKIIRSSHLNVKGDRIERLIALCKKYQADTFYEGEAGKNYIDDSHFEAEGIKVKYQEYIHPVYKQLYKEFAPYMSVIDLLFNHGPASLEILTNAGVQEVTE